MLVVRHVVVPLMWTFDRESDRVCELTLDTTGISSKYEWKICNRENPKVSATTSENSMAANFTWEVQIAWTNSVLCDRPWYRQLIFTRVFNLRLEWIPQYGNKVLTKYLKHHSKAPTRGKYPGTKPILETLRYRISSAFFLLISS